MNVFLSDIGDDCDLAYGIGPWWYNFCPVAFIGCTVDMRNLLGS